MNDWKAGEMQGKCRGNAKGKCKGNAGEMRSCLPFFGLAMKVAGAVIVLCATLLLHGGLHWFLMLADTPSEWRGIGGSWLSDVFIPLRKYRCH